MKVNQFRFRLSLAIVVLGCLIVGNFHTLLQDAQYGNLVNRHIFLPGGNRES